MIKNIFRVALSAAIQRWLPIQFRKRVRWAGSTHLNVTQIRALSRRYAFLGFLTWLSVPLFLAGSMIILIAAAHSFDLYDGFRASHVFWTGVGIASFALLLGGSSLSALRSTKVRKQDLLVREAPIRAWGFRDRYLRPMFEGVSQGLKQPRRAREGATGSPAA
ncbi:MAG TPA: hypothetical protein VIH99_02000 [Bdellovibrionota bacterium]|jgi:hypothetical protein